MRSSDNGDEMSTMVNTVLSGFEYRAQKEEYDNLKQFFEENEDNYQYTGYTKEAINKPRMQVIKMSIFTSLEISLP